MDKDFTGLNAIVCGSTAGIGKATAIQLAQLGAHVTLLARNEAKLKGIQTELDTSKGQKHDHYKVDFTKPEDVKAVLEVAAINHEYSILVNNTGGPNGGPIIGAYEDEFRDAFEQHLICNHLLVQALFPAMKKKQFGRIINVISTSVKQPIPGLGVSNTIRGAVANWSKTLASEIGQFGITVNNVLPGFTETQRLEQIIINKSKKQNISIAEVADQMKESVPAKRFGNADEVANAIVYLASKSSGYINGINLPVDGGRTGSL